MRHRLMTSASVLIVAMSSQAQAHAPAQSQAAPQQTPTTAGPPQSTQQQGPTPPEASEARPVTGTEIPTPANTPDAQGLNDIIVTAQRRSENLQKAAVAVDVVDTSTLIKSGLVNPNQLGRLVPALSVQPNGGANTIFFLRGVGNFTVNGYSDPAIAFNYDGVYVGRPTATSGYFFDLQRIEVLKGPQGTIYGRNATAGAINILPVRPEVGVWGGAASGSYGNYNAFEGQAALNVPLGEDGALRVSGALRRRDGFLTDGSSDDKGESLRVQMLAHLTPDLTVRVGGDYSHAGGKGPGASYASRLVLNAAAGTYTSVPSGLGPEVGLADPRAQAFRTTQLYSPVTGRFQQALGLDRQIFLNNRFVGFNGEIEWKTGAGTLTIIPGARFTKLENIYTATGSNQFVQENDAQYSAEARFAGNRVSIFDYIAGLYYFDEAVRGNYTFDQQVYSAFQNFVNKTKSYAAFARVTAHLTDTLRLVGGVRYTADRKRFDGVTDIITVVCRNPPSPIPACPNATLVPLTDTVEQLPFAVPARGGAPVPQTGGAIASRASVIIGKPLDANKATYRAAAEYDLGERSLLYASFETGYRSGGFALAAGHETFAPEYIDAYTIGSKNRFLDNRLQINVEAFVWKYRDQQLSHSGIDANGVNGVFTDNAGSSTNKGVEIEGQLLATRNTLIDFDVQYLDAKFDSFIFAVPRGATPPVTGCPYSPNGANAAQYLINCSGRPAYNAPKWTVNFGAEQTIPLGDYKLVASADTQYKSSRWVGFDYLPPQRTTGTWTTNANLSLAAADDVWAITGFVRNIENKRVLSAAYLLTTGLALTQLNAAPRTYGVRAAYKF